ncbi:MAG: SDR family oxidoreductase [Alphaproteobacteria bacterium]
MAENKHALVIGGRGVIGRTLVQELTRAGGWTVTAVSRQPPGFETNARFISVDLLDAAAAKRALAELIDVTHLFYAGLHGGLASENVEGNLALLVNAVDAVEPVAEGLRHISLQEGGKYYGRHLGAFVTPAREDDARHLPPNFYYDQQDFLTARQAGKAWSWSAVRPELVCGPARGVPLNLMLLIGVYAAICKAYGLPLRFPGSPRAYEVLGQVTDAGLLARATIWAAISPAAENQPFNLTNADCFRWCNVWPKLAAFFDMPWAPPQRISLADFMADKGAVWDRLVREHDLQPMPFSEAGDWAFADWVFATDWDYVMSDVRRIQAGFTEVVDSEDMFLRLLGQFRADKVIP